MAVVVYIGFAQSDEWQNWAGTYARHAQRFEAASGKTCLTIPYYHACGELMEQLAPTAVVLSGFARSFEQYTVEDLLPVTDWISSTRVPILAVCGSHQLLGFAYNRDIRSYDLLRDQPMRRLEPLEPITNPDYHPEYFMERGFYALEMTGDGRSDPLFTRLGDPPRLYESHYCEIKNLPPDYTLLASTPECRIQAMCRTDRLLYGVQFHPEDYSDRFPDGRILLENFFRLAL